MVRFDVVLALLLVILVLCVGGLILWHSHRIDSFRSNCAEAGGHIYNPGVAFCVSDDGRFIEVYP